MNVVGSGRHVIENESTFRAADDLRLNGIRGCPQIDNDACHRHKEWTRVHIRATQHDASNDLPGLTKGLANNRLRRLGAFGVHAVNGNVVGGAFVEPGNDEIVRTHVVNRLSERTRPHRWRRADVDRVALSKRIRLPVEADRAVEIVRRNANRVGWRHTRL